MSKFIGGNNIFIEVASINISMFQNFVFSSKNDMHSCYCLIILHQEITKCVSFTHQYNVYQCL